MPQKIFSFNQAEPQNNDQSNDELRLEVGATHIAFTQIVEGVISGFELFGFTVEEANDKADLFEQLKRLSNLADKKYLKVGLYINNHDAVIAPSLSSEKEIQEQILNMVYGEALQPALVFSDNIAEDGSIQNIYRVNKDWLNIFQEKYGDLLVYHVYSSMVNKMLQARLPEDLEILKVQWYQNHLIAAVVKNDQLLLVQSFDYKTSEDVQYYLLSICQQLGLNHDNLSLQLSGMIDEFSPMYTGLTKYFKNIVFDNYFDEKVQVDTTENPSHYYTPFFNL